MLMRLEARVFAIAFAGFFVPQNIFALESQYSKDVAPYCLSMNTENKYCTRISLEGAWKCEINKDPSPTAAGCLYWDAQYLRWCETWTDGHTLFTVGRQAEQAPKRYQTALVSFTCIKRNAGFQFANGYRF